MTAADHANTMREAFVWLPHAYLLDCAAALDALVAQAEELEKRANFADAYKYRQRAEAAEAERDRLADAIGQLEEAARAFHNQTWKPGNTSIEAYALRIALSRARAVLARTENTP